MNEDERGVWGAPDGLSIASACGQTVVAEYRTAPVDLRDELPERFHLLPQIQQPHPQTDWFLTVG